MSLANTAPVAFIATKDRARAKAFYGEVLGLPQVSEDGFAVVYDLAGTMLRLSDVADHVPSPHTVLGWVVEDIAAKVAELSARGVRFESYEWLGMGEDHVWQAPGGGAQIAWFLDPDGNNLSLTQYG